LDLLETAENMRVRKNALEAVARIGRRALPPLRAALENDPEWYLKRNIITILGKISGKEAFEILARYMEDPDVRIRREVVRSIAQKRNLAAEDIFIRGLNDSDHAVRHACIVQLGVLRSRKALPELLKEVEIGLFTRVDEKIFREACTAIGKIGDKRGVEPLLSILKRRFIRGNLEEIQASVIWALGEIADESARGELTRFFQGKNPRLRSYAEAALQKLDDKRMNLVAEELEEEEPTIATSLDEEPEEEDAPPPANPR
ncbi:MAG: HEAT repeat domain-containing protein, partial [Deltaproteobacteria bacterium]